MTKRWWLLVGAFSLSVALLAVGFALGSGGIVLLGVIIGVALYFGRKYFE